jgi:IPT/TIG domain
MRSWLVAASVAALVFIDVGCGGTSTMPVPDPPVISSISPTDVFTANLFTNPVTVKITGTGFVAATVAHVDGLAEPTAFTSAQQMTVSVPVSVLNDFSNFGRHQIAAVNPNGDTSNSVQFSVVPLI